MVLFNFCFLKNNYFTFNKFAIWICVCEETYIGETRRNVELQWEEHENTSKDSEPAKYLKENLNRKFSWKISFTAAENKRIRKILEASEVVFKRPSKTNKLNLKSFCYFVTVSHENFLTFNCNYVYIKDFNHHFNFSISKSFYCSTDDALLRKTLTDILNCCDIHSTYILITLRGFWDKGVIGGRSFHIYCSKSALPAWPKIPWWNPRPRNTTFIVNQSLCELSPQIICHQKRQKRQYTHVLTAWSCCVKSRRSNTGKTSKDKEGTPFKKLWLFCKKKNCKYRIYYLKKELMNLTSMVSQHHCIRNMSPCD